MKTDSEKKCSSQVTDIKEFACHYTDIEPKTGEKTIDNIDVIWAKLKEEAERLGYGSLHCSFQVHQGRIVQADVDTVIKRFRADG